MASGDMARDIASLPPDTHKQVADFVAFSRPCLVAPAKLGPRARAWAPHLDPLSYPCLSTPQKRRYLSPVWLY
jgi:hypothetical protein